MDYIPNKFDSSFIEMGKNLQNNNNFLKIANQLDHEGKKRIILDRESQLPYLVRYYYMNLRPFARIVIHKFLRSDIDGLHDHPWSFQTFILSGGYWEISQDGKSWRPSGYHGFSSSNHFHKIELDEEKAGEDTWTLFLMGPKEKEWGFLDDNDNWVYWETYLNNKNKGIIYDNMG